MTDPFTNPQSFSVVVLLDLQPEEHQPSAESHIRNLELGLQMSWVAR